MDQIVKLVSEHFTAAGITFAAVVEFLLRVFPTKKPMSLLRLAARVLDFIVKDRVKK